MWYIMLYKQFKDDREICFKRFGKLKIYKRS